jgi:hypothetical protein
MPLEPDEPKNLAANLFTCHIRKCSSEDLEDFINWVEFHRSEWTDDELERYREKIEHISEMMEGTEGCIFSWLMKIRHYLREEKQARQLCRELIKNKLVIVD